MKKIHKIIVLLTSLPLLGCSTPKDVIPLEVIYAYGSTVQVSTPFAVSVKNLNNQCIVFPADFGAKIFNYDESGMKQEIENIMEYRGKEIILYGKNEPYNEDVVIVNPKLPSGIEEPTDLFVTISGSLCDNGEVFEQRIPFTVMP